MVVVDLMIINMMPGNIRRIICHVTSFTIIISKRNSSIFGSNDMEFIQEKNKLYIFSRGRYNQYKPNNENPFAYDGAWRAVHISRKRLTFYIAIFFGLNFFTAYSVYV